MGQSISLRIHHHDAESGRKAADLRLDALWVFGKICLLWNRSHHDDRPSSNFGFVHQSDENKVYADACPGSLFLITLTIDRNEYLIDG